MMRKPAGGRFDPPGVLAVDPSAGLEVELREAATEGETEPELGPESRAKGEMSSGRRALWIWAKSWGSRMEGLWQGVK